MVTTENVKLTGLFGHPVGHSRSPQMHNAAFQAKQLPYVYKAFDILPELLESAVNSIRTLGIRGVNVTIPHKVEVMKFLDRISPEAELIGAVNTIVNENGELIGYNTDGNGFVRSLIQETNVTLQNTKVLILGAGGASRAILTALAMHGAKEIFVANRTQEKADRLAERISSLCPAHGLSLDDMASVIENVQLIVNTTSVGMHPHVKESPLDASLLQAGQIVSELIYNPRETKLLKEARLKGAIPHGGLGMFVYQGAEAFTLWTGIPAPVDIMRETVETLL